MSTIQTYKVKHFLGRKGDNILVHWDGYDNPGDFTWEPKKNLLEDLGQFLFDYLIKEMGTGGFEVESFIEEMPGWVKVKWKDEDNPSWQPSSRLVRDLGMGTYSSYVTAMVKKKAAANKLREEVEKNEH